MAAVLLWASGAEAANLCVKTGGTDATAKTSISYTAGNEAGSTCWASIGRAVWGSTNRASTNASEAATAGDIVYVFGGTYTDTVDLNNVSWQVAYSPVNEGTAGSPLTITCVGDCVLHLPDADGAAIGADGRDYVKWFADVSLGHSWVVSACALTTAPTGCSGNYVNTAQGTGPVICHDVTGCWIEGVIINGGPAIDWVDNWNGIRLEPCTECTIRNVVIRDFTRAAGGGTNHNQSCVTTYATSDSLIEHVECENTGAGIYFKNTGTSALQSGNIVRYSTFTNAGECWAYSLVSAGATGRNWVYSNACISSAYGLRTVNSTDDWVFNNVIYDPSGSCAAFNAAAGGSRFWNNICTSANTGVIAESTTMPADTVIDLEHNVYFSYATFYSGSDGNRTFASYLAAYTDQDQATPTSITSDPLFVNAAAGDFRLCTGVGTPEAGCAGASPAGALGVDLYDLDGDLSTSDNIPAGAYVTGSETIGLDLGAAASAPDAPTIGSATAGNARCTVTFAANGNGGSPITSFTATSSPGSLTGTGSSSPITVTGLTNGTGYTFTVTATNAEGTSSASSASNSCTPTAPATQGIRINIRGTGEQDQSGAWRFNLDQVLEDPRGVPFPAR